MTILCLLKKNGSMSAKQVGDFLGVTPMGARQHLVAMEQEGLLQSEFIRQKAGRPSLFFTLTDKANQFFPQHYNDLVVTLLQSVEEMEGRDKVSQLLEIRREKLRAQYAETMNGDGPRDRVRTLARLRDIDGYMADIREEGEGYELIEHNCPIAHVAREYPEVCSSELELFQDLLGLKVERVNHRLDGSHVCIYRIIDSNGSKTQNKNADETSASVSEDKSQ